SILRKMTVGNFNWFLHTMLFYHTQMVLERKQQKVSDSGDDSDGDNDSEQE
ncbi:hypothetical protein L208DRAFT_1279474, partial [Tricholoma matsutake]